jgi:hypothetical protein
MIRHILLELKYHSPFTFIGTVIGISTAMVFSFLLPTSLSLSEAIFHVFHPLHILLSATATASVFWRHKKQVSEAFLIGMFGSLGICSISDIIFPYLGLLSIEEVEFHVCILTHPQIVFPAAFIGVVFGILFTELTRKSSLFSHSSHVLVSALASTFYMVGYGELPLIQILPIGFAIIFVSVLIPCCTSDIAFPMLFIGRTTDEVKCIGKIKHHQEK